MTQTFDISFRNTSTGVVCVCQVTRASASSSDYRVNVSVRHRTGLPDDVMRGHVRVWHEWFGGIGKGLPGASYPLPPGWVMLSR